MDLSSDHSPIYLTLSDEIMAKEENPHLVNRHTDWNYFREILKQNTHTHSEIITEHHLDDEIWSFTQQIQHAAWKSTPVIVRKPVGLEYSQEIKNLIAQKRKARKKWQQSRFPIHKTELNKITNTLRSLLNDAKNQAIHKYLTSLTNDKSTEYSLWKSTKYFKRPVKQIPPLK